MENNPGWSATGDDELLKAVFAGVDQLKARNCDGIQAIFHKNVNYVLAGQFAVPPAYRSALKGVIPFSFPVFWNVRRE
jgi:peptide/nickel transport system substrate-binding protein